MAHFAEIDSSNVVLRVLVVENSLQHVGQDFLAVTLGLGGVWVKCSYNRRMRRQFPGSGYKYDPLADVFVSPRPFASWSLDQNYDWQAPVTRPEGQGWRWDEPTLSWIVRKTPTRGNKT